MEEDGCTPVSGATAQQSQGGEGASAGLGPWAWGAQDSAQGLEKSPVQLGGDRMLSGGKEGPTVSEG